MDPLSILTGVILYLSLINGKDCKQKHQSFIRNEYSGILPTLYPEEFDPTIRNYQQKFDELLENVLKFRTYQFSESTYPIEDTTVTETTTTESNRHHHDNKQTTPKRLKHRTKSRKHTHSTTRFFNKHITSVTTSTQKFDISLLKYKRLLQEGDVEPYDQYTNKKALYKVNGGVTPKIHNSVLIKHKLKTSVADRDNYDTQPDIMLTTIDMNSKDNMSLKDFAKAQAMRMKRPRM